MTKRKKSNCEKISLWEEKMWQNSKFVTNVFFFFKIVRKLKKSYCDKTQQFKLWQNFKKPNFYKIQKLKLWHNSKTKIMTKLKKKCDKIQKLNLWQNSKTQIVTKLKNSNCDQTKKIKFWQNSKIKIVRKKFKTQIVKKKTQTKNCDNLKT